MGEGGIKLGCSGVAKVPGPSVFSGDMAMALAVDPDGVWAERDIDEDEWPPEKVDTSEIAGDACAALKLELELECVAAMSDAELAGTSRNGEDDRWFSDIITDG